MQRQVWKEKYRVDGKVDGKNEKKKNGTTKVDMSNPFDADHMLFMREKIGETNETSKREAYVIGSNPFDAEEMLLRAEEKEEGR